MLKSLFRVWPAAPSPPVSKQKLVNKSTLSFAVFYLLFLLSCMADIFIFTQVKFPVNRATVFKTSLVWDNSPLNLLGGNLDEIDFAVDVYLDAFKTFIEGEWLPNKLLKICKQ